MECEGRAAGDRDSEAPDRRYVVEGDRAEQRLRESEAKLALAFSAADMGMWELDLATGVIVATPRALTLFDQPPDTPMTYARFLETLYAADRGRVDLAVREALEHREGYDAEMRVPWHDGSLHWVRSKGRGFYDQAGTPVRMVGVVVDVTLRRRAEEEEQRARSFEAFEAQRVAGVGSWSLDLASGMFSVSEQACRIFGRDPAEPRPHLGANEWAGHPIFSPDDYSRLLQTIKQVVRERRAQEIELTALRPDGSTRTVLARGEPIEERDGSIITLSGTVLDITWRKETEQALRESNRAKDEFLAMLGHELRNPLAPIVTALQILKLREDGQSRKILDIVERQVQHLIRLVDDLLDVSRITRSQIKIERRPARMQDVLAKGAEMAMPLIVQRRHQLDIHAPASELRLLGDEARLAQVFANLLTNAAKYTNPGGHITVDARRAGNQIVVAVADDGIGIARELLPRIFDLFTQERQSTDRALGGLGLGLTIVRSLVELHGGAVQADSPGPGKGSVFTVRLPVAAQEPAAIEASPGEPPVAARMHRRILAVDDNEDALAMLAEILRAAGHEVTTAGDGPCALACVGRLKPDIAILDIGLPGMDGYELAERIRLALGDEAPELIALTGYGQDSDRTRARNAGFAEHLTKPVNLDCLLAAIDEPRLGGA